MIRVSFGNECGLTLAEILAAIFIIGIGIVGLAVVVPISTFGVQEGNQLSTATFLAEEKLEQVRNAAWTAAPANDCLGVSASATAAPTVPTGSTCGGVAGGTTFTDETNVTGFSGYSRTVRITNCTAGCGAAPNSITDANIRLVTVAVTYTPSTPVGAGASTATKSATLNLLISKR